MKRFVDTNVLMYTISTAPDEAAKRARAIDIIEGGDIRLSVQVLQEFYVQATRATRSDRIESALARGLVQAWSRFEVVEGTFALMLRAAQMSQRYRIGYWDAAIVAAASEAGCDQLLTEDLQHGQVIDGVRIVDPFVD